MEIHNLEKSGFRRLKLVDCSKPEGDCNGGDWWDHSYPLQKLFQQFTDLLKTNPRLMATSGDEVKEEVSASAEVGQLLAQPSIVSLMDNFIASYGEDTESVKKSVTASAEYRTRGNQDYALGQMAQAAYYYTMAIVYAPDVDPNDYHDGPDALSLAYGNRSAVFYELGKYEACLADIEHAFSTGYPPVKHPKMLLRKVECLLALERYREANDAWRLMIMDSTCLMSNIPGSVSMETAARMRQITARVHRIPVEPSASDSFDPFAPLSSPSTSSDPKQMLSIINYLSRTGRYEPSTELPPLSAKLETRTTANGNRFLVAAKDIEPGDILLVESPFVSVLNRKYEFHFCHHCCRRLEVNIAKDGQELYIVGSSVPCTHCTRVLYCSTNCRTESWLQYHHFECAILPVLYEMTNFGQLALRTLLVAGLDVASRVITRNVANEEQQQQQQVRMPDFKDPTEVEANYETVYRLALPERDRPPAEFAQFQLASAVMVRALMKQSAFVRTDKEAKLVGTILQRHFIQTYAKSHPISSRISINENSPAVVGESAFAIGLGIYPYLASAWRHSCDANTEHTNVNGSLVLYRATKCIPAGTEVTINLGTTFIQKNWNERKEMLWNRYGFKCDCAKCVVESRDGLDGKYFPIGCKDCGSTLTRTSPTSTSFNCSSSSCSTVMSLSTVAQLYAQAESHLTILNRLFNDNGITTTSTDRLTEAELHVSQLSEMKGMASYCKLSRLNYTLACIFVSNGAQNMAKFGQYYERCVDIFAHNSGVCDALFLLVIKQVDLYRQDAITADGVGGRNRYAECYLQIMKRAIQLARLFTLADARDESTAPDVLVEESRYLWKIEQNLLERVKDFK